MSCTVHPKRPDVQGHHDSSPCQRSSAARPPTKQGLGLKMGRRGLVLSPETDYARVVRDGRGDVCPICRFAVLWQPCTNALAAALKHHPEAAWPLLLEALSSAQHQLLHGWRRSTGASSGSRVQHFCSWCASLVRVCDSMHLTVGACCTWAAEPPSNCKQARQLPRGLAVILAPCSLLSCGPLGKQPVQLH